MANSKKDIEFVLSYLVDEAALKRTLDSINEVEERSRIQGEEIAKSAAALESRQREIDALALQRANKKSELLIQDAQLRQAHAQNFVQSLSQENAAEEESARKRAAAAKQAAQAVEKAYEKQAAVMKQNAAAEKKAIAEAEQTNVKKETLFQREIRRAERLAKRNQRLIAEQEAAEKRLDAERETLALREMRRAERAAKRNQRIAEEQARESDRIARLSALQEVLAKDSKKPSVELVRELKKESDSASEALQKLRLYLSGLGEDTPQSLEEAVAAMRKLQEETERAENANSRRKTSSRGWAFLGGMSFRQVGFQLRSIPGGGVPETLGRLSPLADVFAEIITGTSVAGAGLLGLTAALLGIGLSIQAIISNGERAAQVLDRFAKTMNDARLSAETTPDEDLRSQYDLLTLQIDAQRRITEDARARRDAQRQMLDAPDLAERARLFIEERTQGLIAGIEGALNPTSRPFIGQYDVMDALSRETRDAEDRLNELLIQAGQIGAALINDTNAAADSMRREQRERQRQAEILQQEAQTLFAAERMTSEQRAETVAQLTREIAFFREEAAQLTVETAHLLPLLSEEIASRVRQIEVYNRVTTSEADLLKLSQERRQAAENEIAMALRIDNMNKMQRDEAVRDLQRQIEVIQALSEANRDNTEAQDEYRKAIERLESEMRSISAVVRTRADDIAQAEQISSQTDSLFRAQQMLVESFERLKIATDKANKALEDMNRRIAEIEAEAAEKIAEAARKYAEAIAEKEEKAREDRLDALERYHKKVEEIERRFRIAASNAVANRDALAYFMAQQQRAEDLRKAEEDYREREKKLEESLKKQSDILEKRYAEQLRQIERSAAKAIAARRAQYLAEENERRRAIMQAQVDIQNAENAMQMIRAQGNQFRVIQEHQHYGMMLQIQQYYHGLIVRGFSAFMMDIARALTPSVARPSLSMTITSIGQIVDQRINDTFRRAGIIRAGGR